MANGPQEGLALSVSPASFSVAPHCQPRGSCQAAGAPCFFASPIHSFFPEALPSALPLVSSHMIWISAVSQQ